MAWLLHILGMPKQKGVIKLRGKVGTEVFYRLKDKYYVRKNDLERGKRIKEDPRFAKVRAANSLFGVGSRVATFLYREAKVLGAVDYRKHGELCGRFNLFLRHFTTLNRVHSANFLCALQNGFNLGKKSAGLKLAWRSSERLLHIEGLKSGLWQVGVHTYHISDFEKESGKFTALGATHVVARVNYEIRATKSALALNVPFSAHVLLLVLRNADGAIYTYVLSPSLNAELKSIDHFLEDEEETVLEAFIFSGTEELCVLEEEPP